MFLEEIVVVALHHYVAVIDGDTGKVDRGWPYGLEGNGNNGKESQFYSSDALQMHLFLLLLSLTTLTETVFLVFLS